MVIETVDLAARRKLAAEKKAMPVIQVHPLSPDLEMVMQIAQVAETVRLVLDYAKSLEQRIAMTEHVVLTMLQPKTSGESQ